MGEGIVRESGMDMHTLLCLTRRTSKDLLDSSGNSAQFRVAACMGREFGAEWIHVYIWLSLFAVHLKLSQHCSLIGYTLIQKIFFFLNNEANVSAGGAIKEARGYKEREN